MIPFILLRAFYFKYCFYIYVLQTNSNHRFIKHALQSWLETQHVVMVPETFPVLNKYPLLDNVIWMIITSLYNNNNNNNTDI